MIHDKIVNPPYKRLELASSEEECASFIQFQKKIHCPLRKVIKGKLSKNLDILSILSFYCFIVLNYFLNPLGTYRQTG